MTPGESPRARVYLRLIAINAAVAMCLVGAGVKSWFDIRERIDVLRTVAARECAPAHPTAAVDAEPDDGRPPENTAKEGYFGERGLELPTGALMTELDVVRVDGTEARARLGDLSVLAPDTLHVVNLWAPWCRPCQEELPGLKAMLSRRAADWSEDVAFVPIKVLDSDNPTLAYAQIADIAPSSRVRLADRSLNDALIRELRGDPSRTLYRGALPVSFVLDCDRRVRWAHFRPLSAEALRDLEATLDRLLAEQQRPGACQRVWCGNGRCDHGESKNCMVDCGAPGPGEVMPAERAADLPIAVAVEHSPVCPKNCVRCDADGNCLFGLKSATARTERPSVAPLPSPVECPKRCARCDADGNCLFGLKQ